MGLLRGPSIKRFVFVVYGRFLHFFAAAIAAAKKCFFFSGSADPGSAVPLAKISAVGENLGRSRKSRPFAKISAVRENLGRWRKSRTLAKISDVGENLGRAYVD